jgi:uncharacterized protein (DUF1697 family)
MALVVFLRGVNVGGSRTFRPSLVAQALSRFDVVNVGAAGTFVVRKPGAPSTFRKALLAQLPFEAQVAVCEGRDLQRFMREHPVAAQKSRADRVRFVSILTAARRRRPTFPLQLPPTGDWFVRIEGATPRFVFGEYRRHMKTIGHLGRIDEVVGVPVTTRSWKTIEDIARVLDA